MYSYSWISPIFYFQILTKSIYLWLLSSWGYKKYLSLYFKLVACRWSRGEGKFSRVVLFWLCWVSKNQNLSGVSKYRLENSSIVNFHKPVGEKKPKQPLMSLDSKRSNVKIFKTNQPLKIRFFSGRRLNWVHRMKSVYFNLCLLFLSPSWYLFCFEAVQVLYVIQGTWVWK